MVRRALPEYRTSSERKHCHETLRFKARWRRNQCRTYDVVPRGTPITRDQRTGSRKRRAGPRRAATWSTMPRLPASRSPSKAASSHYRAPTHGLVDEVLRSPPSLPLRVEFGGYRNTEDGVLGVPAFYVRRTLCFA